VAAGLCGTDIRAKRDIKQAIEPVIVGQQDPKICRESLPLQFANTCEFFSPFENFEYPCSKFWARRP
jgi:hypothetical protein